MGIFHRPVGLKTITPKRNRHKSALSTIYSRGQGFNPNEYRFQKPSDKIIISFFGRFAQEQKGILDYFEAISIIHSKYFERYSLEFRAFGKGDLPSSVIHDRVSRVEYLEGEERLQAFAESHIVVMPSKYEPFGLVGLEALASGAFLLVPAGQGMDEYIVAGKNSLIIDSTADSIRDGLQTIFENPGKYLGREEAIRASVQHWTWKRCVDEHIKVYHQVFVGRSLAMKWAYGKLSLEVQDKWKVSAELRKGEWKPVFDCVKSLVQGTSLIVGSTKLEREIFNELEGVTFHSFNENDKNCLNFSPEYVLIKSGAFENVVFLGGIEFVANIEFSINEFLRLANSTVYLTLIFRKRPAYGQRLLWNDLASAQTYFNSFKTCTCNILGNWELMDNFDGQIHGVSLISLNKNDLSISLSKVMES